MVRITRSLLPMLGLAAVALAVIAALPGRDPGLPRIQSGANSPAATQAGPLANLCHGWGSARKDCAAFVGHFIRNLSEREPALGLCLPPPAPLAEWAALALKDTPADAPWAPVLETALTTGRTAPPLPCAPTPSPDAAPATEARPT
ncbi:hypothetical protein [Pseudoroseomonas ludipueritiae]|uniref:Rap1a immunity protein domain-containing protein n=1 Tax=Pseudoroseomonas ludipueritiae TaxID=198093 RepID=A0ABR7R9S4_9PROT|nr:hypothetical protein [Pseudoroseomonas ludipueritiae]MBC9178443.1 hypothetical protein [Pseudoroseomonas ludipueritiae]